jgi:citronellyl-CoA dehydrogenase
MGKGRQFPAHELFKKLGDLGLLGIKYPTEFGGMGLDFSYSMVMAEALGDCNCGGVPMAIGVQTDMCTPALARFGSDELRKEFLARPSPATWWAASASAKPAAAPTWQRSRPRAARTATTTSSTARKMWITNGMQADWCCLLANTSDGAGAQEQVADHGADGRPGITRQKIDKIGMDSATPRSCSSTTCACRSATSSARKGMGFMFQMLQFQEERLYGAAGSLRSLDNADRPDHRLHPPAPHLRQPILDNQVVHFRLAELRTEVECLRA